MKREMLAGVAVLSLLFGGQALSQSVSFEIGAPERTRIKEYVVKEKVKPITYKERISVGATLPAEVELRPVPSDWGPSFTRYNYVYHDDRVVFVEPSSRRVIHVLD